jgi:hypothetical protein
MSTVNRRYQNNNQNNYKQGHYQSNSRPSPTPTPKTSDNNTVLYNVVAELQDYMFTGDNLKRFNKNNFGLIGQNAKRPNRDNKDKFVSLNAEKEKEKEKENEKDKANDDIYKPFQTDSLFWCFYILKYGLSKYEMEVGNQHFPIEKAEKFRYIELFRTKKDILKINKIKPFADLENDLANNQRISIKTFFALCIVEKINILLVDKRKIYESITNDETKINVIHRNSVSYEHSIEFNVPDDKLANYRDTYYKVQGFDSGLKSMTSYKVDELLELCKKFDINIVNTTESTKKKLVKKDIYELLVQNF